MIVGERMPSAGFSADRSVDVLVVGDANPDLVLRGDVGGTGAQATRGELNEHLGVHIGTHFDTVRS